MDTYTAVIDFWFNELDEDAWFSSDSKIDQLIRNRFETLHQNVASNECWQWRTTPLGSLAEIIVLDQFSRNLYRGTSLAFSFDGHALALAQVAISREYDTHVQERERGFFYMPYMHSESPQIHKEAVYLFQALGNENSLKYENLHKDIIDRFGRYPHRNEIIGRESTEEERVYLSNTEHSFFNA